MTTLREAALMALDELKYAQPFVLSKLEAIEALRAALAADKPSADRLAQPKQAPVAWITGGGKGELWWHQSVKFDVDGNLIGENPDDIPLYTAPPQREWQGLTDDDFIGLTTQQIFAMKFAEAKLKDKNS